MARLLLLTNALAPSAEVLPALGLLPHQVRVLPAERRQHLGRGGQRVGEQQQPGHAASFATSRRGYRGDCIAWPH